MIEPSSVTATSLVCRPPPMAGLVLAEFWQMPSGTWQLPGDLSDYTDLGDHPPGNAGELRAVRPYLSIL